MSTLNATGLSREETLARESIQNSSDALAIHKSKVMVRFRRKVLRGNQIGGLLNKIGMRSVWERRELLGLAEGNALDSDQELALLFVEDFGTTGLTGDPRDPASNFYRLLLSLGDSAKSREQDGSGGSYGFGKAAYFLNSRIRTILAHSAFQDPSSSAMHSRLFGCGFFPRHEWSSKSYSGRAWFGLAGKSVDGYTVVDPIVGDRAKNLANELGFAGRHDRENQGTSILIIDTDINIESLLESIETWWWPKLIENQIDVLIHDEDSNVEHIPRPRSSRRADLKPFIDSYQIAVGSVAPIKPYQKLEEFNRMESREIGGLGLVMLTPEQEAIVPEERKNCIALLRQPRMIIQYLSVSSNSPPIAGSFVGHHDIEKYLKLSEPPAHNLWDPYSDRLEIDHRVGVRLVKSVIDRIKRKAREFQTSATPPTPARQNRLQRLERVLGRYFMTRGRTQDRPEVGEAPIHLAYQLEPTAQATADGLLEMRCRFEIRLKEEAPESLMLRVRMNCKILEDETYKGDDLPFDATADGVDLRPDSKEPQSFQFEITKYTKARFSVVTSPYDPDLSVSFGQEVSQV